MHCSPRTVARGRVAISPRIPRPVEEARRARRSPPASPATTQGCLGVRATRPSLEESRRRWRSRERMQSFPDERICFDVRRHGVVLVRPFLRAIALAIAGLFFLAMPWPLPIAGPLVIGVGGVERVRRRLALGSHSLRRDDGEGVSRSGRDAEACVGRARGRPSLDHARAVAARTDARLRHAARGPARGRARAAGAARARPRRATRLVARPAA